MKNTIEEVPASIGPTLDEGRQMLRHEQDAAMQAKIVQAKLESEANINAANAARDVVAERVPDCVQAFIEKPRDIRVDSSSNDICVATVNIRIPGFAWMSVRVNLDARGASSKPLVKSVGDFMVGKPEWHGPEAGLIYTFADPYRHDLFHIALAVAREAYEAGCALAERLKDIPF